MDLISGLWWIPAWSLYRREQRLMEGLNGCFLEIYRGIPPWGMRHPPRVGGRENAEFIGFFEYLAGIVVGAQKKHKRR